MCSRNWKLPEGINSENLLSESDLGLRLELLNGIFYTVNRRVQKLPGFWWVPAGPSLSEFNCRTESSPWTKSWHMKWCLFIRNIIFQASSFRSEQLVTVTANGTNLISGWRAPRSPVTLIAGGWNTIISFKLWVYFEFHIVTRSQFVMILRLCSGSTIHLLFYRQFCCFCTNGTIGTCGCSNACGWSTHVRYTWNDATFWKLLIEIGMMVLFTCI